MKQSQTKELTNQLSAAFSALIQHLWIKYRPSKNSLISSFWYLIFLIANGSIIAGLLFLFIRSDPDMAKLIISTQQDSSTSSFWGIVSAIGSLLAGLGTVGLLAFGWVKGSEWIRKLKASKRLDIIVLELNNLCLTSEAVATFIGQELGEQIRHDFDSIEEKNRLSQESLPKNQITKEIITLTNKVWPHMSTLLAVYSSSNEYVVEFTQIVKAQGELINESKSILKKTEYSNDDVISNVINIQQQAKSLVSLARSLQFLIINNEFSKE
ncbi:hypothetical protein C0J08_15040 [Marinomonas sp. CT5]|uniref:hypothetical protein n=1 Tax=Marinomonas sp. CT5 TaxID=2066133 RepID=UPI001BAEDBE6|nr:hypothetical protein [Marinomonas sp. CT5]QUX96635.1 hypothetical protein C0J08_15040 [Marinomonas sp. CT5]